MQTVKRAKWSQHLSLSTEFLLRLVFVSVGPMEKSTQQKLCVEFSMVLSPILLPFSSTEASAVGLGSVLRIWNYSVQGDDEHSLNCDDFSHGWKSPHTYSLRPRSGFQKVNDLLPFSLARMGSQGPKRLVFLSEIILKPLILCIWTPSMAPSH